MYEDGIDMLAWTVKLAALGLKNETTERCTSDLFYSNDKKYRNITRDSSLGISSLTLYYAIPYYVLCT
jgi:hypothetical protein